MAYGNEIREERAFIHALKKKCDKDYMDIDDKEEINMLYELVNSSDIENVGDNAVETAISILNTFKNRYPELVREANNVDQRFNDIPLTQGPNYLLTGAYPGRGSGPPIINNNNNNFQPPRPARPEQVVRFQPPPTTDDFENLYTRRRPTSADSNNSEPYIRNNYDHYQQPHQEISRPQRNFDRFYNQPQKPAQFNEQRNNNNFQRCPNPNFNSYNNNTNNEFLPGPQIRFSPHQNNIRPSFDLNRASLPIRTIYNDKNNYTNNRSNNSPSTCNNNSYNSDRDRPSLSNSNFSNHSHSSSHHSDFSDRSNKSNFSNHERMEYSNKPNHHKPNRSDSSDKFERERPSRSIHPDERRDKGRSSSNSSHSSSKSSSSRHSSSQPSSINHQPSSQPSSSSQPPALKKSISAQVGSGAEPDRTKYDDPRRRSFSSHERRDRGSSSSNSSNSIVEAETRADPHPPKRTLHTPALPLPKRVNRLRTELSSASHPGRFKPNQLPPKSQIMAQNDNSINPPIFKVKKIRQGCDKEAMEANRQSMDKLERTKNILKQGERKKRPISKESLLRRNNVKKAKFKTNIIRPISKTNMSNENSSSTSATSSSSVAKLKPANPIAEPTKIQPPKNAGNQVQGNKSIENKKNSNSPSKNSLPKLLDKNKNKNDYNNSSLSSSKNNINSPVTSSLAVITKLTPIADSTKIQPPKNVGNQVQGNKSIENKKNSNSPSKNLPPKLLDKNKKKNDDNNSSLSSYKNNINSPANSSLAVITKLTPIADSTKIHPPKNTGNVGNQVQGNKSVENKNNSNSPTKNSQPEMSRTVPPKLPDKNLEKKNDNTSLSNENSPSTSSSAAVKPIAEPTKILSPKNVGNQVQGNKSIENKNNSNSPSKNSPPKLLEKNEKKNDDNNSSLSSSKNNINSPPTSSAVITKLITPIAEPTKILPPKNVGNQIQGKKSIEKKNNANSNAPSHLMTKEKIIQAEKQALNVSSEPSHLMTKKTLSQIEEEQAPKENPENMHKGSSISIPLPPSSIIKTTGDNTCSLSSALTLKENMQTTFTFSVVGYMCYLCSTDYNSHIHFVSSEKMLDHIKTKHPQYKKTIFSCHICKESKLINTPSLIKHYSNEHGLFNFHCIFCEYGSNNLEDFDKHMDNHPDKPKRIFNREKESVVKIV